MSIEGTFSRWGLKDNPFITLPPDKIEDRQRVFTGRRNEVSTLLSLVERPRGIFLCGLFGIGKSILILEILRLLKAQGCITTYAEYDRDDGFHLSILRALAHDVAEQSACPGEVYSILARGTSLARSEGSVTSDQIEDAIESVRNAERALKSILHKQRSQDKRVIIALDELDKSADIGNVHQIIQDTRSLIAAGATVILLGHPFGSTAQFSSSADVLSLIPLGPLSENELIEMMGRYLDLAREEHDPSTYPFTPGAARMIARAISELALTPRIFNLACQLLLEYGAQAALGVIDVDFVSEKWPDIAEDFLTRTLKGEDNLYLEVIYRTRAVSEDTRSAIQEIGGPLAGYVEVRNILANLVQKNILMEEERDGKRVLRLDPLFDPEKPLFRIIR